MYKLTKPLAIALGIVLISVLSLGLAYAYKTSLNPVIKPKLIKSLNQDLKSLNQSLKSLNQSLKTLYFSSINSKGVLLRIILVSAAIIGFFVYKNAIIASLASALVFPQPDAGLIAMLVELLALALVGLIALISWIIGIILRGPPEALQLHLLHNVIHRVMLVNRL